MSNVAMLDAAQFNDQVEQGSGLTLVDFFADWCGPCKMIAPVLDTLSSEYDGKVSIVKLNADDHPEVLSKYGVRGLPTLMMFKDGKPVDVAVGAQPGAALKQFIDKSL
ncbi:thioredoxin [Reinekea marina]|uniref:Thioredoxin n=1 Tax=Reinekea marina TaxID=1310421 RepID=A0ABV7WN78_9GAMM|nr:thioredoxin [Reinekea marina]MBU2864870.1 thioredoxin [Reinekea forsetii]MDN3648545.1 thioredoxin [Reinekea marina]